MAMNGTAAIRVMIVDDDTLVRQLLTQILTAYPDIEVVGQAATGDEAISSVERFQPNIVICYYGYSDAQNGWCRCDSRDYTPISSRQSDWLNRVRARL
jgi:DNA-binding NarL/FixJ family response regulator